MSAVEVELVQVLDEREATLAEATLNEWNPPGHPNLKCGVKTPISSGAAGNGQRRGCSAARNGSLQCPFCGSFSSFCRTPLKAF